MKNRKLRCWMIFLGSLLLVSVIMFILSFLFSEDLSKDALAFIGLALGYCVGTFSIRPLTDLAMDNYIKKIYQC